jgi:hypothetical protein
MAAAPATDGSVVARPPCEKRLQRRIIADTLSAIREAAI